MGAGASAFSGKTTAATKAATPSAPPCRYGAACYNFDPEHRKAFSHPSVGPGAGPHRRRACKYGLRCYNDDRAHLQEFVHPGDRNYRLGLVVFSSEMKGPEFETLWQIFNYFDPEESGHLTQQEFSQAAQAASGGAASPEAIQEAWQELGGEEVGTVNFARFSSWTASKGVDLPLGLERAGAKRPCRCRLQTTDGSRFRCSCPDFKPRDSSDDSICECGHKASMHRSEVAEKPPVDLRTCKPCKPGPTADLPTYTMPWAAVEEGLVPVTDKQTLLDLQRLLSNTHKATDNWTRDRGCTLHGLNGPGCSLACASKNRAPVPKGYALRKVLKNQNSVLWQRYCLARSAITDECARGKGTDVSILSTVEAGEIDVPLEKACNELRVLHGTNMKAARDICNSNFRPALAGTGATWKDAGKAKGVPLYGYGLYMAERITKADEYAKPVFDMQVGADVCAALVVRCVAGRVNVVTTNHINTEQLRKDVFDGPYHSVLGDRVSSLGKPYREVVIYDKDQCFPEYLLLYERQW
eukprot:TRINITY_DN61571_c0_g1_i1.p1 TRINITY_DN61571_c0_g1~~TRINITY_DN61571_c0_g1_i1.p1  ORF type:complete len:542 (+),score=91.49 TRINITY_DN61571_c0_g1_i1:52-1626(+)